MDDGVGSETKPYGSVCVLRGNMRGVWREEEREEVVWIWRKTVKRVIVRGGRRRRRMENMLDVGVLCCVVLCMFFWFGLL